MIRHLRWLGLIGLAAGLAGGCAALGVLAYKLSPEGAFAAAYKGLPGQRVAIVVWTDRSTEYHYPMMGADVRTSIARNIHKKLTQAQATAEELKGTVLIDARQSQLWLKNHPEFEGRSLAEVAPHVGAATGASRVIYVEVTQFMTRDPRAEMLLKGLAVANIRVAEVQGPEAKIAYEEVGVTANFPEKAPEGLATSESIDETFVLQGLINAISQQTAMRFFSYSGYGE